MFAEPIPTFAADPAGLPNFHRVNAQVYRGAQPTAEGIRELAKLGVKVVVNLRDEVNGADEQSAVEAAGMRYITIPMRGLHAPTNEQIASVLKLLNDPASGPVFVHCRRGADRTGTVLACYRITHDHWDNTKALAEARSLGMSWIERAMQSYVLHYRAEQPVAANPTPVPAVALTGAN
jgi:uncharacterized protein (TIGR01244 family)